MSLEAHGNGVEVFEQQRPRLRGLAYRMLGSLADADDVVQDTWLRWSQADTEGIRTPQAWLTTVATRLAVDRIRSNEKGRETYPGPWLPEPLVSRSEQLMSRSDPRSDPAEAAELADSLTLGFLTLLDQLGPVERAVFVLADVFAVPYADIALTVGRSEAACRQAASRARRRLRTGVPRQSSVGADRRVIDRLMASIAVGDIEDVVAQLAPGVVCVSDGGPERRAARRPVVGATRVARFLVNVAKRYLGQVSVQPVTVNGDAGFVATVGGVVDLVAAFEVVGEKITLIRFVRNPSKLAHITDAVRLE